MARIRTVKPELYFDEELAEKSIRARYLFIGLFTQADRRGRLEDRVKNIKANIFPYDKVDVNAILDELTPKFLIRYEVQGKRLIQIRNFEKHQRISGKETSMESEYDPPQGEATGKQWGSTREAPEKHPGAQERKGKERNKGEEATDASREASPPFLKTAFQKPTAQEVTDYAKSLGFNLDGNHFVDHYEANGWMRGKSKIRDWRACVRTWWTRAKTQSAGGKQKVDMPDLPIRPPKKVEVPA